MDLDDEEEEEDVQGEERQGDVENEGTESRGTEEAQEGEDEEAEENDAGSTNSYLRRATTTDRKLCSFCDFASFPACRGIKLEPCDTSDEPRPETIISQT